MPNVPQPRRFVNCYFWESRSKILARFTSAVEPHIGQWPFVAGVICLQDSQSTAFDNGTLSTVAVLMLRTQTDTPVQSPAAPRAQTISPVSTEIASLPASHAHGCLAAWLESFRREEYMSRTIVQTCTCVSRSRLNFYFCVRFLAQLLLHD